MTIETRFEVSSVTTSNNEAIFETVDLEQERYVADFPTLEEAQNFVNTYNLQREHRLESIALRICECEYEDGEFSYSDKQPVVAKFIARDEQ